MQLPTSQGDTGRRDEGVREAKGMTQFSGQAERFSAALEGRIGIAEPPQNIDQIGETMHPGIRHEAVRALLPGAVEGKTLLKMQARAHQLS
jgi:hypothetical protein